LGGVLLAPFLFATPDLGLNLLVKALLAAVVGGFGSYPGALLGGLIIGVADNVAAFYVSTAYRDVLSFGLLITILLARPTGLLGQSLRVA
jgi:branched-chain amino acid transport system permease protein